MSHDHVGADLEHLDALARAYETAGREIAGRAAALRTRIETAVAAFEATASRLAGDSALLTRAMDEEAASLLDHAAAVAWTGANRAAFDADLSRFVAVVRAGSAAIDDGVATLRASVEQRFAPVLADFGAAVRDAGDGIEGSATSMQVAVAGQRAELDEVANVGWMST